MSTEGVSAEYEKKSRRMVLLFFVGFFLVIILVNAVFAYIAVTSHTGLVTRQAYEKGLAYNETLERAAEQAPLRDNVTYKDGVLHWSLFDQEGKPLEGVSVKARLFRPVQDGHDFEVSLKAGEIGVYSAFVDVPMKGAWTAKLEATWDGQSYRTTHKFIVE